MRIWSRWGWARTSEVRHGPDCRSGCVRVRCGSAQRGMAVVECQRSVSQDLVRPGLAVVVLFGAGGQVRSGKFWTGGQGVKGQAWYGLGRHGTAVWSRTGEQRQGGSRRSWRDTAGHGAERWVKVSRSWSAAEQKVWRGRDGFGGHGETGIGKARRVLERRFWHGKTGRVRARSGQAGLCF